MSPPGHFDVGSGDDDMVFVADGGAWAWAPEEAANAWPSASRARWMASLAAAAEAMIVPEWVTGDGGRVSAGARPGTEVCRPP